MKTLEELKKELEELAKRVEECIDGHIGLAKHTDITAVAKICSKNVSILIEALLYVNRAKLNLEKKLPALMR